MVKNAADARSFSVGVRPMQASLENVAMNEAGLGFASLKSEETNEPMPLEQQPKVLHPKLYTLNPKP